MPALCAHVSAFVCLSRVAVIDGPSELKYLDCYGGDLLKHLSSHFNTIYPFHLLSFLQFADEF